MSRRTAGWVFGAVVVAVLSGCAGVVTGPSRATGFDVLLLKDATGQQLMVMPSTGIMLRDGSRASEDVRVEWTQGHDAEQGRLKVFSERGRLLADVSVRDIAVQHRAAGFAGAEARPVQIDQLAALADGQQ